MILVGIQGPVVDRRWWWRRILARPRVMDMFPADWFTSQPPGWAPIRGGAPQRTDIKHRGERGKPPWASLTNKPPRPPCNCKKTHHDSVCLPLPGGKSSFMKNTPSCRAHFCQFTPGLPGQSAVSGRFPMQRTVTSARSHLRDAFDWPF